MILQLSSRRRSRTPLANRTLTPELLETAAPEVAARNLSDIARINRWFGGHAALIGMMRDLVDSQERFSVLDVGAGSGDMGRCLMRYFPNARVISLDHRPPHLRNAASPRVVAHALRLPFLGRAFDFVLCSSFLHHFQDDEVIEMIASLRPYARRALLLLDLERHRLPYRFIPLTRRLLRWSPLTLHDSAVSVAAAFRLDELVALARAAGAREVVARRHRPWFRVSVAIPAKAPANIFATFTTSEPKPSLVAKNGRGPERMTNEQCTPTLRDNQSATLRVMESVVFSNQSDTASVRMRLSATQAPCDGNEF
jgi:SAM-dependent methyltransferase